MTFNAAHPTSRTARSRRTPLAEEKTGQGPSSPLAAPELRCTDQIVGPQVSMDARKSPFTGASDRTNLYNDPGGSPFVQGAFT